MQKGPDGHQNVLMHCWHLSVTQINEEILSVKWYIQCSSEISEPKYMRKTHIIRVFVYTHTSIDIYAY